MLVAFAFTAFADTDAATPEPGLESTVAYLIDYVAESDFVFVRNGKAYSSGEAADHIRRKYKHFLDEISTAEDFIRLAASKSILTGRAYEVRLPGHHMVKCEQWLLEVLDDYRNNVTSRR